MPKLLRALPMALVLLHATGAAHAAKWWPFGGKPAPQQRLSPQDQAAVVQVHALARQNAPGATQLALDQARALVSKAGDNALVCKAGLCAVDSAVRLDVAAINSPHTAAADRQQARARLDALRDPTILRQFVGDAEAQRVTSLAKRVQQLPQTPRATRVGDTLILYLGGKL